MTSSPLRVGFVTERAGSRDGWGRYAAGVAREMRGVGVDAVLVTAEVTLDPSLDGLEQHPVLPPLFRRRFETPRILRVVPALRRLLATCDVVHVLAEPYLPAVAASLPRGVPLVHTAHGTWSIAPLSGAARRWIQALALGRVDLLVCQSRLTRDRMSLRVPLPPSVVWPGGVHPDEFGRPAVGSVPEWCGAGPVALSVGAMKERKGHHVALEAVALALASVPELRWVVIAADERTSAYQEALAARAASLGVADRLRFLGSVSQDDLAAWYQRADVFLLLPVTAGDRIEGLGLVYLEAAAAGTPSIGSRDTGAAEAIVDRETGLLVPQRDSAAAAAALVQLLTDEGARRRMGEAARRRAQDLSWSRLAERLADAYRRLSQGARWSPEVGA